MKKPISLLCLVILCVAGKPSGGGGGGIGWYQLDTNLSRWTTKALIPTQQGDVATSQISYTFANYTAFILTNINGNISGKTITATFAVAVASGDPFYVWGGYNVPGGGYGTMAEGRLYFSTHTDYPRNGNPTDPDNYWFTPFNSVLIDDLLGTVTISCDVQPANWSNSFGTLGSSHLAGFMSACQNVHVAGLALGSNNFYDTGIATTNGTAILHLHSLTIQ